MNLIKLCLVVPVKYNFSGLFDISYYDFTFPVHQSVQKPFLSMKTMYDQYCVTIKLTFIIQIQEFSISCKFPGCSSM